MALTPTTDMPLGFEAPAFSLPDVVSGRVLDTADLFAGGPTVVVFMCNHCPYVVHVLEGLVAFAQDYQPRGLNFLAISSNDVAAYPQDGPQAMKALAEAHAFTFPYLFDEDQTAARAYHAACTPDISVFDANRKCVYRGQFDASRPGNDQPVTGADLRRVADLLLAGQPVPAEGQIPSIGCNIKWKPVQP